MTKEKISGSYICIDKYKDLNTILTGSLYIETYNVDKLKEVLDSEIKELYEEKGAYVGTVEEFFDYYETIKDEIAKLIPELSHQYLFNQAIEQTEENIIVIEDLTYKNIKELKSTLTSCAENLNNCITEKRSLADTIEELTVVVAEKEEEITCLNTDIETHLQTIDDRDNTILELDETIINRDDIITERNEQLTNMSIDVANLNDTIDDKNEVIQNKLIRIGELNDVIEIREDTINSQSNVIGMLYQDISNRDDTIDLHLNTIDERDETIILHLDTITEKDNIIYDKDNIINNQIIVIGNLEGTIIERNETITLHLDTIKDRDNTIDDKIIVIGNLEDTILEKNETIISHSNTITERDNTIDDQIVIIGSLEDTILEKNETIVSHLYTIAELEDIIIERDETIALHLDTIEDRDNIINNQIIVIGNLEGVINEKTKDIVDLTEELNTKQLELDGKLLLIQELHEIIDGYTAEVSQLNNKVEQLEAQIISLGEELSYYEISAPTNLIPEYGAEFAGTTTFMPLNWDAVEHADRYEVQWRDQIFAGEWFHQTTQIEEPPFTVINNLLSDTIYQWRVRGISSDFNVTGSWSGANRFIILPADVCGMSVGGILHSNLTINKFNGITKHGAIWYNNSDMDTQLTFVPSNENPINFYPRGGTVANMDQLDAGDYYLIFIKDHKLREYTNWDEYSNNHIDYCSDVVIGKCENNKWYYHPANEAEPWKLLPKVIYYQEEWFSNSGPGYPIIPQRTNYNGGIKFDVDYNGSESIQVLLKIRGYDFEGHIHVGINGTDKGSMSGPDRTWKWYEFNITINPGSNQLSFWSISGDAGKIKSIGVYSIDEGVISENDKIIAKLTRISNDPGWTTINPYSIIENTPYDGETEST